MSKASDPGAAPAEPAEPAQVIPAVPAPARPAPAWNLGRLTKIIIENYRGVRGSLTLDLPAGENLLIYGENGAGKSSVFHAIRDFLESAEREYFDRVKMTWRKLKPDDFAHRFTTDKPRLSLHFGPREFAWSVSEAGPQQSEARDLDKGKGFLDYKALQMVHLLERQALDIDLFPLVIDHLLPHYPNTVSAGTVTFSQQWSDFLKRSEKPKKSGPASVPITQAELDEFNKGFGLEVVKLGQNATILLKHFGDDTAVSLTYQPATLKPTKTGSTKLVLHPPRLLAHPIFRRLTLPDYDRVLNEARLSALALCLFFAALKDSPSTSLRLLALDDILIGLDMSNRVKVMDLIQEHFKQWQIIILTYSKAWFERLKAHMESSHMSASWKAIILFEDKREQETSPRIVVEDSGDRIEMAARHLRRKDYHGAAVYVRIALEGMCHQACAAGAIPVPHVESQKDRKLEHFLAVLDTKLCELLDDERRKIAVQLLARIRMAKGFVLNRNAHFDVEEEDTLSGEIVSAIATVKNFGDFLKSQHWAKSNFRGGQQLTPAERLTANIGAARDAVSRGGLKQALGSLGEANEAFWEIFGARLGVQFPVGTKPTTPDIWNAAKVQNRLSPSVEARLNPLRPYLYGSVKSKDIEVAKFADAANTLEELATPPAPA